MVEKIIACNLYKAIISMKYFDMVQRYIIINKKMEIKSCVLIKKSNERKNYGKKLWKVGRPMPQIRQDKWHIPRGRNLPSTWENAVWPWPARPFPALYNHRRHSVFGDDEKKDFEEYNYGLQVFSVETKLSFMPEIV